MRAGRLNHKVTLQRRQAGQDAAGQPVDTWIELATRRARVEPGGGREYLERSGQSSEVTTRFTLRYDSSLAGLTPADRLVFNGSVYDIEAVINSDERNIKLTLMCVRNERRP